MQRFSELEKTAYHEAGHAAIGLELRLKTIKVSIVQGADSLGHVLHRSLSGWAGIDVDGLNARAVRYIESSILCLLAGGQAEMMLAGYRIKRFDSADWSMALDLASYIYPSMAVCGPYLEFMRCRARHMLCNPLVYVPLAAIADELLREYEISGRRALAVYRKAQEAARVDAAWIDDDIESKPRFPPRPRP